MEWYIVPELDRGDSYTNIVNVTNAIKLFIKDQTTNRCHNINEPQGKGKVDIKNYEF